MTLYRHVLKAAARFPSKNRDGIVEEIKTEFRVARGETDGEVLKKKLALVEKYEALKAAGKLEEFMAKRRKKVMLRDRTLVPRVRNN